MFCCSCALWSFVLLLTVWLCHSQPNTSIAAAYNVNINEATKNNIVIGPKNLNVSLVFHSFENFSKIAKILYPFGNSLTQWITHKIYFQKKKHWIINWPVQALWLFQWLTLFKKLKDIEINFITEKLKRNFFSLVKLFALPLMTERKAIMYLDFLFYINIYFMVC